MLLQMQHPLQKVRTLQHGPGEGQFPEGLKQLADKADLLVLLCSLEHGSQGGHQVGGCGQLAESEAADGAGHGLQLGLPHREAYLLCAVLPHEAHEVGKGTCRRLLGCETSFFSFHICICEYLAGAEHQLANLQLTGIVVVILLR